MKHVFHIISTFPATIKFFENNKECFCVSTSEQIGDEINLLVEDFVPTKIFVYPHDLKKFLPYSFFISENFFVKEKNVNVFVLPEKNIVLKLFPALLQSQTFSADKFEIENKDLKKLTFLNDIAGRAKVEVFNADSSKLEKKEEFCVYLNREKQETQSDFLLLDFFESVLAKDFKYATSLLSTKLASTLNIEIIQNYFGNFCSCKIVNYFSVPAVVLFFCNNAKVFACEQNENKITDIYEIN